MLRRHLADRLMHVRIKIRAWRSINRRYAMTRERGMKLFLDRLNADKQVLARIRQTAAFFFRQGVERASEDMRGDGTRA